MGIFIDYDFTEGSGLVINDISGFESVLNLMVDDAVNIEWQYVHVLFRRGKNGTAKIYIDGNVDDGGIWGRPQWIELHFAKQIRYSR